MNFEFKVYHDGALVTAISSVPAHGHSGPSDGGALDAAAIATGVLEVGRLGDIGTTTPAVGYFSALRLKISGFFAIFTHANSADRTYTLPNYDATIATIAGTETLTGKTLTTPTVASLTNMQHDHSNAAGGGTIPAGSLGSGTVALARGGTAADNSSQTANKVFATPVSGGAGVMSIRALVDADIPSALVGHAISTGSIENTPVGAATPNTGKFSDLDQSGGTFRLPNTATPPSIVSQLIWNSAFKYGQVYDGVQARDISGLGWLPYARQIGASASQAWATSAAMAANGGTYLIPIHITTHMKLYSASVFSKDTSSARTWGWDLYVDYLNNTGTLDRIAQSSADETFTASAVSTRTITANSQPVSLPPGFYWLALQCRHATNTFAVAADTVATGWTPTNMRFKTTTNPNGATLDIVAGWTNIASIFAGQLNGLVAGQSTPIF